MKIFKLSFLPFLFYSCSYSFYGFFPKELKKVSVEIFENTSQRFGIELIVTENFIKGLQDDGRLEVVDPQNANLVIKGVIKGYKREPQSYDTNGAIKEYKVTITTQVEFYNKIEEKEFIPSQVFSGWSVYNPAIEDEENGIKKGAEDLSVKVLKTLFSAGW